MKKTLGVACCAWLLCSASFAATVTGKISGDELRWLSGRGDDGLLVSNAFDHVAGLPRTEHWVAGTFATSTETLILKSSSGGEVSVPAKLVGATYAIMGKFASADVPAAAPRCTESILAVQTTVINRDGPFCVAKKSARYDSALVPFNQYRPILKLDRTTLIDAFKGKPTGTYSGVVTGTLRYGFFVHGSGALSYRNIPVTFSVQLRNTGSRLSQVSILGNGHISPTYDTYKHIAKGMTGYKVTAYGAFEAGLRFRFVGKDADDYTLKLELTSDTRTALPIPYSMACDRCTPRSQLVDDGHLKVPGSWVEVRGTGESITFDLVISYRDVKAEDVTEGVYRDSFTLMLEAIL